MKLLTFPRSMRLSVLAVLVITFSSCKDDDPDDKKMQEPKSSLTLEYKTEASGKSFNQFDTITNDNGQKYTIKLLRFYAGNIRLVKEDNSEIALKDIALIDFYMKEENKNAGVNTKFTFEVPSGNYKSIKFGVGVPENLNGLKTNSHDPSQYPVDHPLSISYSTSWSMAGGGYRFAMIDGTIKKTGSDSVANSSYHTGFDELYREVEVSRNFSIKAGDTYNFPVTVDVNKIFYIASGNNNFDMWQNKFTHGVGDKQLDLARKVTENFKQALK